MTITAAEPIIVPACERESKSSVTFSASDAVRIGVDEPPGMTAFSDLPSAIPPPTSWMRSRSGKPCGSS